MGLLDDSYTKSLLHFDGADTSTTFTDESGKTWTASGNAQIDTAQSKFGGASGLFDGTGDYIDTPDHDDFTVGSGDLTIDAWVKINGGAGTDRRIITQMSSVAAEYSFGLQIYTDNKFYFQVSNGTVFSAISNSAYTDTDWHHVAGIRYGNTLYIAVDGVFQTTTGNVTGVTVTNSTYKPTIGRAGEANAAYWNGWIDEFRFSKGIARWTADFEPRTAAYMPGGQFIRWSS